MNHYHYQIQVRDIVSLLLCLNLFYKFEIEALFVRFFFHHWTSSVFRLVWVTALEYRVFLTLSSNL